MGVPGDDVLSLNEIVDKLVQFDEVVSVGVDVDWGSFVVVFGSEVDANDGVGNGFLTLNVDLVFVWLMVEPLQESLDVQGSLLVFLLFLLVDTFNSGVVEVDNVVLEVSDQVAEVDLLYLDSWQDDVVVLVGWERFLVVSEDVDDVLQEVVEGWIANSGGGDFQG